MRLGHFEEVANVAIVELKNRMITIFTNLHWSAIPCSYLEVRLLDESDELTRDLTMRRQD